MKWTTEAKVGAFTLAGLLLCAVVLGQLSHLVLFGKDGYPLEAIFREVGGLSKGNVVRYSGVDIGRVDDVRVRGQEVAVRLKINEDVEIPKNSQFTIETTGVMGEHYVAIVPGNGRTGYLAAGDVVAGGPTGGMDALMRKADRLIVSMQQAMDSVNRIVGDEELQSSLKHTVANVETLSGEMIVLSGSIEALSTDMQALLARLDGDGQASGDLRAILHNMRETSNNARVVSDRLRSGPKAAGAFAGAHLNLLYNMKQSKYGFEVGTDIGRENGFVRLGGEGIGDETKLNLQYGKRNGDWTGRIGMVRSKPGAGVDYRRGNWKWTAEAYDLNDMHYRLRAQWQADKEWSLLGQAIWPNSSPDGGWYIGAGYTL